MALLIVAVLWFVLIGDQPVSPDDEIAEAPNNDVDHLKPPEPAPPKPKKAAKPAPPPQDPLEFTVKPIYWTGAAAAGRQKHLYAPTLRATDSTLVRTLCIRLPQVVETIQLQLLSEHPQDHMATPAELKAIGARTTRAINEKLGKSVVAEIRFTVGAGPRKGEPRPVALARRCGQ